MSRNGQGNVLPLSKRAGKARRKTDINHKKDGSVRRINDTVYVDFMYLDVRVRESTGLPWTDKNANDTRKDLDKVMAKIESGTFRFHEAFPLSQKCEYFREREEKAFNFKKQPGDVKIGPAADKWYETRRGAQRVTGRTLLGQKSHIDHYIKPFFGDKTFGDLNSALFEEYVGWARKLGLRGRAVCNTTINKSLKPLRMLCTSVTIQYGWGGTFDPFFGWENLPEPDPWELIFPFSIEEQKVIRAVLPAHWVPYFDFAFRVGLRPGEQIALKPGDIDWRAGTVSVRHAITLDENGKRIEGPTKNKYSRRTIKLNPTMLEPLLAQKEIHGRIGSKYFFRTEKGSPIYLPDLRVRIWAPALEAAELQYRAMKQTRHSFATNALTYGESPSWIATVMGHRNTDMVIKVYAKYLERTKGIPDGGGLARAYEEAEQA
jgi:integrase